MSEPSLHDVQRWMKLRIRPGAKQGLASDAGAVTLNPQRGTSGTERLAVYAQGYVTRMREALAEVYEAVHHVLGEQRFSVLAAEYALRYPSDNYNLNFAGRHLPEFLAAAPPTERLPFLPDLARLEWLVCLAFHADDQTCLDPASLSSLAPERWSQLRLIFQPSVGMVASSWPIQDLRQARHQPRETINIDVSNRPQRVLVFRQQLQVTCELISEAQQRFLERLLQGCLLGEACEMLTDSQTTPEELVAWSSHWASSGLIARCELGDKPSSTA